MRGHDGVPAGGGPIGRGPVAVGEVALIGGVLDHAIDTGQSLRRDAFLDDGVLCMSLDDAATPVTSNRARNTSGAAPLGGAQQRHLTDFDDVQSMP